MRYALSGVIEEIGQTNVERGLRRGSTLAEIATSNYIEAEGMLKAMHLQIKFTAPASVCIHLEAAPKKEIIILDPFDLFQICPRSFTKGRHAWFKGNKSSIYWLQSCSSLE